MYCSIQVMNMRSYSTFWFELFCNLKLKLLFIVSINFIISQLYRDYINFASVGSYDIHTLHCSAYIVQSRDVLITLKESIDSSSQAYFMYSIPLC